MFPTFYFKIDLYFNLKSLFKDLGIEIIFC